MEAFAYARALGDREDIIMIASEPLTFEQKDWMEVKTNTMVVITPKVSLVRLGTV